MTLVLKRVELRNFLSHQSTVVSFDRGVTVLVGENGAGKSSIVDAVYLALTGDYSVRGTSKDSLIRRGAPSASVAVEFEDTATGNVVRIDVNIPRGRSASMTLRINGRLEATGVREVPRVVAQLLGIPASELREAKGTAKYALILRQGYLREIVDYLTKSPEERSRFFDNVLGASAYRKAGEALRDLDVEVEGFRITASQTSVRMLNSNAEKLRREAERLRGERAGLQREVKELEAKLSEVEAQLAEASKAKEEYEKLRGALERVEERLREVESELLRLEGEAAKLSSIAGRLAPLEREYERLKRLAGLASLVAELEKARRKLGEVRAKSEAAARLAEALREYLEHAWAEEKLRELKARSEDARRRQREAEARAAKLEEKLSAAERVMERARVRAGDLAELAGIPASEPQKVLEAARAKAEKLRREAENLASEAAEKRAQASKARGQAERLLLYARSLRGEERDRCPLCGQPLPEGGASTLASRLEDAAKRLLSEAEALDSEASELEARAREAEAKSRLIESVIQRLEVDLESIRDVDFESLRLEYAEARRAAKRAEEEASKVEAEAVKVEESARKAVEARARALELAGSLGLARLPSLDEAERLATEARRELSDAEAIVESIERRLVEETGLGSVDEAVEAVSKASNVLAGVEAEYRRALEAKARLSEVESRIRSLKAEKEKLGKEREEIVSRIREIEPLARDAERLEREKDSLTRRLGEAKGRLEQIEKRLTEIRDEEERLERARWQLSKLLKLREILEKTLPRKLLQARLAALERLMTDILSSFDLDYKAVVVSTVERRDGTPLVEIKAVSSTGEEASLSSLSGGEKTAVALAFALALGKISSINAGFLILDEPTAELDEERRRVLVDVLRSMGRGEAGIPQLVVVTHDEEVKEAADTICTVSKPGGVSVVRCGVEQD